MIRTLPFFLFPILLPLGAAAVPSAEEIISNYRSTVGPEASLKGIETLIFRGTLTPAGDVGDLMKIEIILKQPRQQLLRFESVRGRETIGVNGTEGFRKVEPADGETIVIPLETNETLRLTSNAIENLSFMDYPDRVNVRVLSLGLEKVLDKELLGLRFVHRNGMEYLRYFDPKTFDLVATGADGKLIFELGEKAVGDLSFGSKLEVYEGDKLLHSIEFDEILVNEPVADSRFDYPEE